jgi:DNA-directed RNA polymerase specialized sigma24 family protein
MCCASWRADAAARTAEGAREIAVESFRLQRASGASARKLNAGILQFSQGPKRLSNSEFKKGDDNVLGTKSVTKRKAAQYATASDFCRIFREDMNGLYLLAFLLTGDEAKAEQCFVGGLEDSHKTNPVFKNWAQSWARRMIISNAIRMVQLKPGWDADAPAAGGRVATPQTMNVPEGVAGILELPSFERFAFVLRVLAGYSDRECCLLLNCTVRDLSAARMRAFQEIATAANRQSKLAQIESSRQKVPENPAPTFSGESLSHLAATA